jgi:hypothetical protein
VEDEVEVGCDIEVCEAVDVLEIDLLLFVRIVVFLLAILGKAVITVLPEIVIQNRQYLV